MCEICGCGAGKTTLIDMQTGEHLEIDEQDHEHVHADGTRHRHHHHHHDHDHDHDHDHAPTTLIDLNTRILAKNDKTAESNRAWFTGRNILVLNLMSAPGAGKTTLLERTIVNLKEQNKVFVLEGDQATSNDGERVKAAGAAAVQINTGSGCHLDAEMVARGFKALNPTMGSILFIENVGNLVCPSLFDLGERKRVAILSVTEGDDKPLKYPHMFRAADLLLFNKIDLLAHVDFDIARAAAFARDINPRIEILSVSARTGEGVETWENWILREQEELRTCAF